MCCVQNKRLNDANAAFGGGHRNHKQKIHLHETIKLENATLRADNSKLLARVRELGVAQRFHTAWSGLTGVTSGVVADLAFGSAASAGSSASASASGSALSEAVPGELVARVLASLNAVNSQPATAAAPAPAAASASSSSSCAAAASSAAPAIAVFADPTPAPAHVSHPPSVSAAAVEDKENIAVVHHISISQPSICLPLCVRC